MKKSLLIVFLVLVIAPILVIAWMSYSDYNKSRNNTLEQYRILSEDRLKEIDRLLLSRIKTLEASLRQYREADLLKTGQLREIGRSQPLIRQIFILDKDGFIFPPENGEISGREAEFLQRAYDLELVSLFGTGGDMAGNEDPAGQQWFTWFMGDGINFIFLQAAEFGKKIGIELDRIALISRLISVLPDSVITGTDEYQDRISVSDARGKVLYQWGLYQPADGQPPLTGIPLSLPLGAWRLKIYMNLDEYDSSMLLPEYFSLFSGLAALIIVITGLAVYFYRENTRAIREAVQRVSFVNQVSHEFKTPLTNIGLYGELLAARLSDKKNRDYLSVILLENGRLSRMINNVLTFSHKESSTIIINTRSVIIDDIILRTVALFTPLLDEKSFNIATDYNAGNPVYTDPDIIEQILSNLISNTEKFATAGKYLGISSYQSEMNTLVVVSDRGPGIPVKERRKIFKPFYRINNCLTEGVSGTGIGLYIAAGLAERIGGALSIEESDSGAVFRLVIPSAGMPETAGACNENTDC